MTAPASPVELPQLPKTLTMLSDLQSGTMQVVHVDLAREWGQQCYEAGVRAGQASKWKQLIEDPNIQDPPM